MIKTKENTMNTISLTVDIDFPLSAEVLAAIASSSADRALIEELIAGTLQSYIQEQLGCDIPVDEIVEEAIANAEDMTG